MNEDTVTREYEKLRAPKEAKRPWHLPYCVGGQPVDQFDFVMHSLTCVRLALRCDGGFVDNDTLLAMADVLDFVNAGLDNLRPIVAAAEDRP